MAGLSTGAFVGILAGSSVALVLVVSVLIFLSFKIKKQEPRKQGGAKQRERVAGPPPDVCCNL
jgi:hypothetical protein